MVFIVKLCLLRSFDEQEFLFYISHDIGDILFPDKDNSLHIRRWLPPKRGFACDTDVEVFSSGSWRFGVVQQVNYRPNGGKGPTGLAAYKVRLTNSPDAEDHAAPFDVVVKDDDPLKIRQWMPPTVEFKVGCFLRKPDRSDDVFCVLKLFPGNGLGADRIDAVTGLPKPYEVRNVRTGAVLTLCEKSLAAKHYEGIAAPRLRFSLGDAVEVFKSLTSCKSPTWVPARVSKNGWEDGYPYHVSLRGLFFPSCVPTVGKDIRELLSYKTGQLVRLAHGVGGESRTGKIIFVRGRGEDQREPPAVDFGDEDGREESIPPMYRVELDFGEGVVDINSEKEIVGVYVRPALQYHVGASVEVWDAHSDMWRAGRVAEQWSVAGRYPYRVQTTNQAEEIFRPAPIDQVEAEEIFVRNDHDLSRIRPLLKFSRDDLASVSVSFSSTAAPHAAISWPCTVKDRHFVVDGEQVAYRLRLHEHRAATLTDSVTKAEGVDQSFFRLIRYEECGDFEDQRGFVFGGFSEERKADVDERWFGEFVVEASPILDGDLSNKDEVFFDLAGNR